MEGKKNITKGGYITLCFGLIALGTIIMSICTYLFAMKIETNYSFYFNIVGGIIIGSGIGLSYSRVYNIEGLDY